MSRANVPEVKSCKVPGKACYSIWKQTFEIDEKYLPIKAVGRGAYGVVCSARNRITGEKVAIKKINNAFASEVDAIRTLREMNLLRGVDHENVIKIKDVMKPASPDKFQDVYIVYECMDTDLHQIIRSNQPLTDDHLKYFIWQLLRGLKYLHSANIIHRDLKPSNLLINADCDLKICDFGLARFAGNNSKRVDMTQYVVTRWYRAPDLFLLNQYSSAIDMWSVGCILGELLQRKPLFQGEDFIQTLKKTVELVGRPDDTSFVEDKRGQAFLRSLPLKQNRGTLRDKFPNSNKLAVDLMEKLLQIDPQKRLSAAEALNHPWLASVHDESVEPVAEQPFKYTFDDETQSTSDIRNLVHKEVLFWYEKNNPKKEEGANGAEKKKSGNEENPASSA